MKSSDDLVDNEKAIVLENNLKEEISRHTQTSNTNLVTSDNLNTTNYHVNTHNIQTQSKEDNSPLIIPLTVPQRQREIINQNSHMGRPTVLDSATPSRRTSDSFVSVDNYT